MDIDRSLMNNQINEAAARANFDNAVNKRNKKEQSNLLDGALNSSLERSGDDDDEANAKAADAPDAFTPTPPQPQIGYTKPV